jgi:hypothetical protein
MDTSKENITRALEMLNQKVSELELSIDVKENFLIAYKKHVADIAMLNAFLQAKDNAENYELALQNILKSILQ